MINAIVTAENKIFIDPKISIIDNNPNQEIQFLLKIPQNTAIFKFYAVFKPVYDTSVEVELTPNKSCKIPVFAYNKYMKLCIALIGKDENGYTVYATNYCKVDVVKGGTVFNLNNQQPDVPETPTEPEVDTDNTIEITRGSVFDTILDIAGVENFSIIKCVNISSNALNGGKQLVWDNSINKYRIYFTAQETAQFNAGEFTYDIVVLFADNDVETIINNAQLIIK